MLHTSEVDMTDSVDPDNIDAFVSNASWAICSTYHTVLMFSPGAAVFGRDMLIAIPYLADWHKTGIRRQKLTDHNTARENACRADYDCVVGGNIMIPKDGILCKRECSYDGPIMQVHANSTIRVQRGSSQKGKKVQPYHER